MGSIAKGAKGRELFEMGDSVTEWGLSTLVGNHEYLPFFLFPSHCFRCDAVSEILLLWWVGMVGVKYINWVSKNQDSRFILKLCLICKTDLCIEFGPQASCCLQVDIFWLWVDRGYVWAIYPDLLWISEDWVLYPLWWVGAVSMVVSCITCNNVQELTCRTASLVDQEYDGWWCHHVGVCWSVCLGWDVQCDLWSKYWAPTLDWGRGYVWFSMCIWCSSVLVCAGDCIVYTSLASLCNPCCPCVWLTWCIAESCIAQTPVGQWVRCLQDSIGLSYTPLLGRSAVSRGWA